MENQPFVVVCLVKKWGMFSTTRPVHQRVYLHPHVRMCCPKESPSRIQSHPLICVHRSEVRLPARTWTVVAWTTVKRPKISGEDGCDVNWLDLYSKYQLAKHHAVSTTCLLTPIWAWMMSSWILAARAGWNAAGPFPFRNWNRAPSVNSRSATQT